MFFSFVKGFFIGIDLIHESCKVFSDSVNVLISVRNCFGDFLPFGKENVSLIMFFFELFCSLVQLNLTCLGGCDFLIEFLLFSGDFQSQLFDLKIKLSDFCIVFLSVFLKDNIILFFLFAGNGPLLKLLLIPVEFKLDLFNFFIGSENSDLDVIKSFLIFSNDFVMFFYFVLKSATLSFSNLPEMVFGFSLFIFLVNKAFSV
jgi:hypothetical protein